MADQPVLSVPASTLVDIPMINAEEIAAHGICWTIGDDGGRLFHFRDSPEIRELLKLSEA